VAADHVTDQVSFTVRGLPPAKSEALSIFGIGHSHAPRVRRLLEAARRALAGRSLTSFNEGPVALDLVIRAPAGQATSDATHYLGGVGDVLEDKSHRPAVDHLGSLAGIWLYRNDRQIKEVTFREIEADEASYTVTVRAIDR
jgi:hypothetical protein